MKRMSLFVIIAFVLSISILTSGCGAKKSSYAMGESGSAESTEQSESSGTVIYKSLIDKYVGEPGSRYKAYDEILKWDDNDDTIACMLPASEWLDSDGKLKLPFDWETLLNDGTASYASFYVPDELAVKASVEELADISLRCAATCGLFAVGDIELAGFEMMVKRCNALEESLRREDFADVYLDRYIEYALDLYAVPKYYESLAENDKDGFLIDKSWMLDFVEIILGQPETYEQLTEERRVELVKSVIVAEKVRDNDGISFFFGCITNENYVSDKMGECTWEANPWLDAVRKMKLTEEERSVVERYIGTDR
ncbi:MAG: hypothetical protein HDT13_10935 [Butyrivibrio sp.]|nr:hypothetical protein [Butyrivibrio sp.]